MLPLTLDHVVSVGRQWLIKHRDEDNLVTTVSSRLPIITLSIITCGCGVANC